MNEPDLIARLRGIATHPAARGLADDAAVLGDLVLTHDMLVEGVHFLPADPPGDVAWKLLAVNLSDLAAKGATPLGVLMGFTLGEDGWDRAFVDGLGRAHLRRLRGACERSRLADRAGGPRRNPVRVRRSVQSFRQQRIFHAVPAARRAGRFRQQRQPATGRRMG